MKELLKITRDRLRNHLHYSKWYYIAAIIVAVVLVNITYAVTEPGYPRESRVSIIMYGGIGDEDIIETWEGEMLALLDDDQREVDLISSINAEGTMDMVIVARTVASDDDIMILNSETMKNYANQGAFLPLDDLIGRERIKELVGEDDLSAYEMYVEGADKDQIYYLPLSSVDGFNEIGLSGENMSIGILANSPNVQNAMTCFEYIMSK